MGCFVMFVRYLNNLFCWGFWEIKNSTWQYSRYICMIVCNFDYRYWYIFFCDLYVNACISGISKSTPRWLCTYSLMYLQDLFWKFDEVEKNKKFFLFFVENVFKNIFTGFHFFLAYIMWYVTVMSDRVIICFVDLMVNCN